MAHLALFDVDGTITPTNLANNQVHQLRLEVLRMLNALAKGGTGLVPASGVPLSVLRTLSQQLDQPAFALAGEFGCHLQLAGCEPVRLSNSAELEVLEAARRALHQPLMEGFTAHPDPRDIGSFFSYFWSDGEAYGHAIENEHDILSVLDGQVPNWRQSLTWGWGGADLSSCCRPRSVHKGQLVRWAHQYGHTVAVAAGNTMSDSPMLVAAQFAIITHEQGEGNCDELLATVQEAGVPYYAAAPDQPDGAGLCAGLLAARQTGVVRF